MHEIRKATVRDVEGICAIRDEAWIDTYPSKELGLTEEAVRINAQGPDGELVPKRITWFKQKILNKSDNWAMYVGLIDSVVRGFVVASIGDDGKKCINSLYVKPGYQGKGLGADLMQKAIDWLDEGGDIYLEVAAHNQRAIKFYERFGFKLTHNKVEDEQNRPSYVAPIPQAEMILDRTAS
ncbi:GNAT family N-acetyltransferase [Candidatus Dojkabacteria bacterium]|uniref:GNAT family N-acetyltransferase n=1 Tax=Candidatus Dojkabacteria bacterium TaxID=2099670 RepID=A0A955I562_9BACT|nr:GNAT family N-acetyltransferase [Candidatus Saccharibacteria bacterium]MCA9379225.1 GNAT family N-acetyltransferase [Candidatus Dojkabacteria bacterium]